MMLVSDMVLAWDPEYRKALEVYSEDEEALAKVPAARVGVRVRLGRRSPRYRPVASQY